MISDITDITVISDITLPFYSDEYSHHLIKKITKMRNYWF